MCEEQVYFEQELPVETACSTISMLDCAMGDNSVKWVTTHKILVED